MSIYSLFLIVHTIFRISSGITFCNGINLKPVGADFTEHRTGLNYL